MGRKPNFRIAGWHRLRLSSDYWDEKAQCARRRDLPWAGDYAPPAGQLAEMEAICVGCPVQRECASSGLDGANGGFYAGIWLPWPTEYRKAKEERRVAMVRLRRFLMKDTIAAVR